MFRKNDPYTPNDDSTRTDYEMMDILQKSAERAINDVCGGRGVAPMCELCEAGHPADGTVENDLPPLDEIEAHSDMDELAADGIEGELFP
jgi:hypothetical protein